MNKITLLFMLLFSVTISAQSDFDIAKEFMSKKGVTLVNNPSRTRGENKPYSVFNGEDNKGFAIVVNGSVVGYDTENTIDEDDMPCCLKEMLLDTYSKTVKPSRTRGDYTPDWWTPRNVEPIEPLIKTRWKQSSPFNDLLDRKTNICFIVAWCQILHYFRIPHLFGENGEQVGDTLKIQIISSVDTKVYPMSVTYDTISVPVVEFNHDLMNDMYEHGEYTEEEAQEVAKLYYYYTQIFCGVSLNRSLDCHWEKYMGFHYEGNYYENNGEEKGLYYYYDKYLEQKYPFWTCGDNHAYVVDGRDSEGRYHINFGWGGNADGYYVFPNTKEEGKLYSEDDNREGYVSLNTTLVPQLIYPTKFSWSPTTDIISHSIDIFKGNNSVYNLQGVKVGNSLEGLSKGIYIQGGKKYVVK